MEEMDMHGILKNRFNHTKTNWLTKTDVENKNCSTLLQSLCKPMYSFM